MKLLIKIILKYLLPKKQRQKVLNRTIDYLIEQVGEWEVATRLLVSMERTFKVETSKKYKTTEEEIDNELMKYPKLIPYKIYFTNTLRDLRTKHGLNP